MSDDTPIKSESDPTDESPDRGQAMRQQLESIQDALQALQEKLDDQQAQLEGLTNAGTNSAQDLRADPLADYDLENLRADVDLLMQKMAEVWPRKSTDEGDTKTVLIPVKLIQTGGSAGDGSSECSFVYTITRLSGETIDNNIGMAGHGHRPPIGAMTAGTYGAAFQDDAGTWKLFDADEQISTRSCAPPP